MGIDAVDRTIAPDQLMRCLLPHFWDAGNVVSGISHESLDLDHLTRRDLITLRHVCRMIIFDRRLTAHRFRDADADFVCRDLQKISVPGYQRDRHTLAFRLFCAGSEDIVCLDPRSGNLFHSHGCQYSAQQRHLRPKLLRHGLARSLVSRIHFMPERRRMLVKGNNQIIRLLLVQNPE